MLPDAGTETALEVMVWFGQVPVTVIPVPAWMAGEVVPVPPLATGITGS